MSLKRRRTAHYPKPHNVVRTISLSSGDSLEEREKRKQKEEAEAEVLNRFREYLHDKVQVRFTPERSTGLIIGLFKKIEPGPRLVLEDPHTGLPISCYPSQVSYIETDSTLLYQKPRW